MNLLDESKIQSFLSSENKSYIDIIEIFDVMGSTSDHLKSQNGNHHKLRICLAEHQTAGRGQFGRTWFSPYAQNIYLSLLWYFRGPLKELSQLSVYIATAVKTVLKKYGVHEPIHIKHPNDVLVRGKKISGCLIETQPEDKQLIKVVIGIGLNVSMEKTTENYISQSWIDVSQLVSHSPDRNKLAAMLIEEVIEVLQSL